MRIFLIFLLTITLASSSGLSGQPAYTPDLNQKLALFTGSEIGDCGVAIPTTSPVILMKAYNCLVRAKIGKQTFKFAILTKNFEVVYYSGVVTDKSGVAHLFRYIDGDRRLRNDSSFELESCDSACLRNFFDAAIEMSNHLSARSR